MHASRPEPHPPVRPHPAALAERETLRTFTHENLAGGLRDLAAKRGIHLRLELKLLTDKAAFWLCTEGLDPNGPADQNVPFSWINGCVTISYDQPIPNSEQYETYGPGDIATSQALDYMHFLAKRRAEIRAEQLRDPSPERAKEIECLTDEVRKAIEALGAAMEADYFSRFSRSAPRFDDTPISEG
jgi:hypothetical protein